MYSNHQWNEADHPRDNEGKFTFKGMGSSRNNSFINTETKNYINMQGIDIGNIKEILLKVLKNFIIPGVTVYATVNQLMKMIKRNKLEDKLEKAIQEFKKNNKQNSNKNNQESPSDT